MSVDDAIKKYSQKQLPSKPRRKNKKPELELQKRVLAFLRHNGFSVDVVEAKATYNPGASRYISQAARPGMSDLIGVDPYGHACFIELKAPGRLKTLRANQRKFLEDKLACNAFAVVIDSVDMLRSLYSYWIHARKSHGINKATSHLIKALPEPRLSAQDPLLDTELGF